MNIETLAPYLVGLFGLCGSFIGLLGVGLGALISYLNNRQNIQAQVKQRKEERDEHRRETKIQLELELTKNDIEKCMDAISNIMISLDLLRSNNKSDVVPKLTVSEISKIKLETSKSMASIFRYLYSLGTEFDAEKFLEAHNNFMDSIKEKSEGHSETFFLDLIETSGKLHSILRDKLISIRDSE